MEYLNNVELVVASIDNDGRASFLSPPKPATHSVPGAVEAAYFWGTDGIATMPGDIGGAVSSVAFPPAGGTRFGLVCFPPRSAGKLNVAEQGGTDDLHAGDHPGMHRSDSVDYEVIISGKVDIVLENGDRRTLTPGSCLVMGGIMHAWENIYDEPCIYAVVVVGAASSIAPETRND